MVTTLHGWAELRYEYDDDVRWTPLLNVGALVDPDYDCFAALFGVRNSVGYPPVAADRGIPPDASELVLDAYPGAERGRADPTEFGQLGLRYHGGTHLTLAELSRVDWSATPEVGDPSALPPEQWRRAVVVDKYEGSERVAADVDVYREDALTDEHREHLRTRREATADGCHYVAMARTRERAVSPDMERVIQWVRDLGDQRYREPEELRMVVWFEG